MLFLQRLKLDWDKQVPSMRKAWLYKDAQGVHACCGIFLHLMAEFKACVPAEDYERACPSLKKQFDMGYLDPELESFLTRCVPPANLHEVSFLRTVASVIIPCL